MRKRRRKANARAGQRNPDPGGPRTPAHSKPQRPKRRKAPRKGSSQAEPSGSRPRTTRTHPPRQGALPTPRRRPPKGRRHSARFDSGPETRHRGDRDGPTARRSESFRPFFLSTEALLLETLDAVTEVAKTFPWTTQPQEMRANLEQHGTTLEETPFQQRQRFSCSGEAWQFIASHNVSGVFGHGGHRCSHQRPCNENTVICN